MIGGTGNNTGHIPDWRIIAEGAAGRLGKRIEPDAFFEESTKRLPAGAILSAGAIPLVLWREKVCEVVGDARTIRLVCGWRESGVYRLGLTWYLIDGESAAAVDAPPSVRRMVERSCEVWQ